MAYFGLLLVVFVAVPVVRLTAAKVDCSTVKCALPQCPKGEIPVKFSDECCYHCLNVPGTEAESLEPPPSCPQFRCQAGYEVLTQPGQCCGELCVLRPTKKG